MARAKVLSLVTQAYATLLPKSSVQTTSSLRSVEHEISKLGALIIYAAIVEVHPIAPEPHGLGGSPALSVEPTSREPVDNLR